jgi:DNA helicase-2/ATP-dependent DNA helicase PcrA
MDHHKQRFKRFPEDPDPACKLEEELRPSSELSVVNRPPLDRTFDDLIRKFFVAFSRAQDVLLLVGTEASAGIDGSEIPNVATGWDREENWIWESGLENLVHI